MDISKIDINFIEIFSLSYTVALDVFGVEPINASAKMQRKIRKWIEKNYIADETYPQKVMQFIGKEVSDEDFIEFIKLCHGQIQLKGTHKKQLFEKFSADLAEDVKSAIWELIEDGFYYFDIRKAGTEACIDLENREGYVRTLILLNPSNIPEGKIDFLSDISLIKRDDEYRLVGKAENYEEDSSVPFAIRFTDAKVDIALFRADEQAFAGTPWMNLQNIADGIVGKYFLSEEYLNEREKELLPLLIEIDKLSYWAYSDELKSSGFPQLTAYITKFGYNELLPIIERLEKEFFNNNKKDRIVKKLLSKLNTQKYEPLWREIYRKLIESQTDYSSKAAVCSSVELLKETRKNIQKLMESHGYTGEYPDFVKKGSIRGVRLVESYDMSYFVGAEKNVAYHIHCTEEYFDEYFMIEFLCGTELLRKNETAGDVYSCLFNAKGRRLFQTVSYESGCADSDGENKTNNLERRVQIAVKKAELIKLTKDEQKEINGFAFPSLQVFFLAFFVMGVFFGLFMTVGFILIAIVACLIFGQPQTILSMLTDVPWWAVFLLSWVLFGGAMGIITVLAKRK